MSEACVFCAIAAGGSRACIVHEDDQTITFLDLRQFHPGHVLVIPRLHIGDVRELHDALEKPLMASVARATRAVAAVFPNEGLSVWHSIGPAAFQEVPHLHFHVHPRRLNDGLLRIYPGTVRNSEFSALEHYASMIKAQLCK